MHWVIGGGGGGFLILTAAYVQGCELTLLVQINSHPPPQDSFPTTALEVKQKVALNIYSRQQASFTRRAFDKMSQIRASQSFSSSLF